MSLPSVCVQEPKFTTVPQNEEEMDGGKDAGKKKTKKEKKVDLDNLKRELEMVRDGLQFYSASE